jgi:TolB-like protein/Tfp pilus assembly protein PilF
VAKATLSPSLISRRTTYIHTVTVLDQLRSAIGDRYDLERELGGGGMSQVFVAIERALERRVVIKVLPPELGQSVNADRFRREIATLATLQHPQIVPIHAAGTAGDLLYYVMPFVTGESLRAKLERDGRMAAPDVVRLVAPLARALAYAHREGIVHRDIKPENVLLAQGEPVLADFGIAKVLRDGASHGSLTSAGMSIGTVTYMAPEQVLAEPDIDGRADVYSLAALSWELLAGRPPFDGTNQQVMSAHVVKPAPAVIEFVPECPEALSAVLSRALAKDAGDRYTADEFAVALEEALRATTGAHRTDAVRAEASAAPRATGRSMRGALIGAVVAVVAGSFVWFTRTTTAPLPAAATPATPATASARAGIAVLAFEQIGGDDDAYLAAGLTDELMTQLAEVPELRVAARTTVRAFADSALPPAELGARLDVRALVEGSVQRAKNQLRVTTRLVDVRDGSTLWTERYERTTDDLFAVQREIGAAVVTALTPRLGLRPRARTDAKGTTDAAAFDLYLRAKFAMQQRGADSLRVAVLRFREAIRRDSTFARAWAGVAEASALLPVYAGESWTDYAPQIREAAARAIALDSTLGTPHFALASAAKGLGDWATAEREFDLALARQPDLGATHQNRAELLYTLGRVDDAVTAMSRAATLEPRDAPIVSQLAGVLVIAGRLDSASRVLDRALVLDSNLAFAYWSAMMLRERQGDVRRALTAVTKAARLAPLPFFTGLTIRAARLARDTTAVQIARRSLTAGGAAPGNALALAIADADVAPPESTIARLDRAITERDPFMWQIPLRLWWFDPVRGTPGFAKIAQRLALPAQALEPLPPPGR